METIELEIGYTNAQLDIFYGIFPEDKYIVVPKGRRFGITQGGCQFALEEAIDGAPNLWGDTITGNIERYFERYMKPILENSNIPYRFSPQQKKLTFPFCDGFIDFRSADRPENWEGFGYKNIFLNEAGIILKNDYLYTNTILPMLLDFPDSRLFAMGTPKGKKKKDGQTHKFYQLFLNASANQKGYRLFNYSSYDNPLLDEETIKELEEEIRKMSPSMVKQEIYGEFVDEVHEALWQPEMIEHITEVKPHMIARIVIAIDPNKKKGVGDDCGIMTAARLTNGEYVVLADRTGDYSPGQWGTISVNEFKRYDADCYVVEVNQGGDMCENVIRQYDKHGRIKQVHAYKGKALRAEPVVSLYERKLVKHMPGLNALENEMLTWVQGDPSPNRIDAMVYALTELNQGKKEVKIR